ncbi:phosphoglucosamine mutase [Caldisericum exile]|uniref:Phosphoglucosamine mutase n=1 Tax=Caldisericum exile (strain DSM 21853 / NBRC 104410 / AZM16c01) TaxID=511051 RepID=A0A7U6JFW9_CALEA|nr:phosphoglucosamine mutase [Caldisericum exile]BAL80705.1 phosphoglucosamine mutase [Caldisericum exile AZM16c01]
MRKIFGTDGARGIANIEITPEVALRIGTSIGKLFYGNGPILIGEDTRLSSEMLRLALATGIISASTDVTVGFVMPTPAVSLLTRIMKNFSAGCVISASHNPIEFNGIKIFDKNGFKLSDEVEEHIEKLMESNIERSPVNIGRVFFDENIRDFYVDYIAGRFPFNLSNLKIALDLANGGTYYTTPRTLQKLGAQIIPINDKPDGHRINVECGSTHPQVIAKHTINSGAHIGISHDGDGDRVILSDETGRIVDGDEMMVILGRHFKKKGLLKNNTIVGTVMTNLAIEKTLKSEGINFVRAPVGDRYVLQEMLKTGAILGGEQSGHIINLIESVTGDGLITALSVIGVMIEEEKPLSKLVEGLERLPQILVNANVKDKNIVNDEKFKQFVSEMEKELKNGRVLIRPSGTEPVIRIMVEGDNEIKIKDIANRIKEYLEV